MMFLGTLRVALRALSKNRLRSLLTMLGIIIGVGAFVAMMAIGVGARVRIMASVEALGSNLLVVMAGSATQGGAQRGSGTASSLTTQDAAAIEKLTTIRRAAPIVRTGAQLLWGASNWSSPVVGTTPAYLEVRSWNIAQGAAFSEDDVRVGAKVCLVGKTVVDNLFGPAQNPLGETIRVKGMPCRVIAVLEEKGSGGFGDDQDDLVMMPWTTLRRRILGGDPQAVNLILASAVAPDSADDALGEVGDLLRQRHRLGEGDPDDFLARNPTEIAKTWTDLLATYTNLLMAIALISLLVGGIGIMNIMLVSVTERTREIGIRVALGARAADILWQFVVEAVLLSAIGGGLGMGLGVLGAQAVAKMFDWPHLVDLGTLALSFGVAAVIGVVFGLYPAVRASRLDPIEALRYE